MMLKKYSVADLRSLVPTLGEFKKLFKAVVYTQD